MPRPVRIGKCPICGTEKPIRAGSTKGFRCPGCHRLIPLEGNILSEGVHARVKAEDMEKEKTTEKAIEVSVERQVIVEKLKCPDPDCKSENLITLKKLRTLESVDEDAIQYLEKQGYRYICIDCREVVK